MVAKMYARGKQMFYANLPFIIKVVSQSSCSDFFESQTYDSKQNVPSFEINTHQVETEVRVSDVVCA